MKNKFIMPFGKRAVTLYVLYLLLIAFFICISVHYLRIQRWGLSAVSIIVTIITILGYLVIIFKGVRFKTNFLKIPPEYTSTGKQTEPKVFYNELVDVEFLKKEDNGPHIKNVFGVNVDTIMFTDRNNKNYLMSAVNYSNKQIKFIIEETKRRSNLK